MIGRDKIRTLERGELQRDAAALRKGYHRGTMSNAYGKKNKERRQRREVLKLEGEEKGTKLEWNKTVVK